MGARMTTENLTQCMDCHEWVLIEDIRMYTVEGGVYLWRRCRWCEDELLRNGPPGGKEAVLLARATPDPLGEKARIKLERAEDNLKSAICRYLKNCPSEKMLMRVVEAVVETHRRENACVS